MPEHSPEGNPAPPHKPSTHLAGLQDKHQPERPLSSLKPAGSSFERLCFQTKPDCAPRWPSRACWLPRSLLPSHVQVSRRHRAFPPEHGCLTTNLGCSRSVKRGLKQEGDANGVSSTSVQGRDPQAHGSGQSCSHSAPARPQLSRGRETGVCSVTGPSSRLFLFYKIKGPIQSEIRGGIHQSVTFKCTRGLALFLMDTSINPKMPGWPAWLWLHELLGLWPRVLFCFVFNPFRYQSS